MTPELIKDNRAIAALPIRLLVSLIVGVAALSLMMGALDDVRGHEKIEVGWQPQPGSEAAIVETDDTTSQQVSMQVTGEAGTPISGEVIITSHTARLDNGPITSKISNGEVTVSLGKYAEKSRPRLRPMQNRGTLEVLIIPSSSKYVDDRDNREIVVVSGEN
jgi:hypothetical protein